TASLSAQNASDKPKAEIIYTHGNVYTGAVDASSMIAGKRAEAIAIRGNRILLVGTREEVLKLKGPDTTTIDLGGHFVMPGFNDAHLHLADAGMSRLEVDLVGVRSLDEMKQRIAEGLNRARPGEWILGRGWDHTLWPSQQLPTRQDLDSVTQG